MGVVDPDRAMYAAAMAAARGLNGIVMLNLLRFAERASYPPGSGHAPGSGREAYARYAAQAREHVEAAGGSLLYSGRVVAPVIAPADERWDACLLVRYPSADAFHAMVASPDYQRIAVHRTAALADSRLILLADSAMG